MITSDTRTILYIGNRDEYQEVISQLSPIYSVEYAQNIYYAFKFVKENHVDAILFGSYLYTDSIIKDSHIASALAAFKTDDSVHTLPVIALIRDLQPTQSAAFKNVIFDFLLAPFSVQELTARLEYAILHNMKMQQLQQKNHQLEFMVITDPLTGLYNRWYLNDRLHGEILRSVRYCEDISCLMLDIDHFKKINDNYGHYTGDKILREAAARLKSCIRECDIAIRYGGEEFLVICPNTDKTGALNLASRIKQTIESKCFVNDDSINDISANNEAPLPAITVSIGVSGMEGLIGELSSVSENSAQGLCDALIINADNALYHAKNSGRSRIVIS